MHGSVRGSSEVCDKFSVPLAGLGRPSPTLPRFAREGAFANGLLSWDAASPRFAREGADVNNPKLGRPLPNRKGGTRGALAKAV